MRKNKILLFLFLTFAWCSGAQPTGAGGVAGAVAEAPGAGEGSVTPERKALVIALCGSIPDGHESDPMKDMCASINGDGVGWANYDDMQGVIYSWAAGNKELVTGNDALKSLVKSITEAPLVHGQSFWELLGIE